MTHEPMQLVLITPPTTASTELKTVNSLFHTGLPVLHVRKPDADVPFLRRYLHEIEPHFLSRVVLHQHHELAQEFNLKVKKANADPMLCDWVQLAYLSI